uniref:Replication enhancer n=1 Tax=Deinbollia mosaic virus TaxID=1812308 RepID=A0A142C6J9_9GEMI|nr:replication enhancer protein [Deinbollia mosaic virus]
MDSRTGDIITAPQAQNGVFTWQITNPLHFRITDHLSRPFNNNHDIISIQIRFNHSLRKALGIHKCFLNFKVWTRSQMKTGRFLTAFKSEIIRYLDNLGVISINSVIRSVDHVLYNVFPNTLEVKESHEIKFLIY